MCRVDVEDIAGDWLTVKALELMMKKCRFEFQLAGHVNILAKVRPNPPLQIDKAGFLLPTVLI